MLDKQLIFDIVAKHLLTQNSRSLDRGLCCYRNPNGRRCAIGVLISDEVYSPMFEGDGVIDLLVRRDQQYQNERQQAYDKLREWFDKTYGYVDHQRKDDVDFLVEIQRLHDSEGTSIDEWPLALAALAGKYGLDWRIVSRTLRPGLV